MLAVDKPIVKFSFLLQYHGNAHIHRYRSRKRRPQVSRLPRPAIPGRTPIHRTIKGNPVATSLSPNSLMPQSPPSVTKTANGKHAAWALPALCLRGSTQIEVWCNMWPSPLHWCKVSGGAGNHNSIRTYWIRSNRLGVDVMACVWWLCCVGPQLEPPQVWLGMVVQPQRSEPVMVGSFPVTPALEQSQ